MTHRQLIRAIVITANMWVVSTPAMAQPQTATVRLGSTALAELQQVVDQAAIESGAVGAQVSMILGDERADFVFGSANVELGLPMTVDTAIQVGSVTKVLNAALIMTLVEEGRLELNQPVKTYIPDLSFGDAQAAETITLRQLLSMTAGLDNGPYTGHGGGDDALARFVGSLNTLPQAFSPGTAWGYSNTGTSIAGYAAERVTGELWHDLLRARILTPAGLDHTVSRARELPHFRVSVGHAPASNGEAPRVIRPYYISEAQAPAGATMAMSAHDLASFGQVLVQRGRSANGEQVLAEASVATMITPVVRVPSSAATQWAVGVALEDWSGTTVYGHSGGNLGGTSFLHFAPEQEGVIALALNTPAATSAFRDRIWDAFGPVVFGAQRPKLAAPAVAVSPEDPTRYVGTYVSRDVRYDIAQDGLELTMTVTADFPGGGDPVTTANELLYLDEGRFFVLEEPGSGRPLRDVAFFGDDGEGRAMNLVAPVFPAKRVN